MFFFMEVQGSGFDSRYRRRGGVMRRAGLRPTVQTRAWRKLSAIVSTKTQILSSHFCYFNSKELNVKISYNNEN